MSSVRILVIVVVAVVGLAVLRFRPWERSTTAHRAGGRPLDTRTAHGEQSEHREQLTVGFLPVT